MRTTLDIADDILFAAKELAQREKKSLGQVISELARRAFVAPATPSPSGARPLRRWCLNAWPLTAFTRCPSAAES